MSATLEHDKTTNTTVAIDADTIADLRGSSNAEAAPVQQPAPQLLKLAWLTTEYPKASHTFVRRELEAVEQLGHSVERFSIRSGGPIADPADIREAKLTTYLLQQSPIVHALSVLQMLVFRPLRFMKALQISWQMYGVSGRGVVRHVAYLVEACTLTVLLKRRKVQHVHVHFGKNAADVARLMHCLGGPTYSMQIHGPGEFDNPAGFSLGAKVADSLFTTAITGYATAQLRRWTPLAHWNKLNVIRCGVNDFFLNSGRPLNHDSRQFVCIGRLTAQKGQLLLLDAIAEVVQSGHSDVRLVLAGDGEMRSAIEARVAELGIQNQVKITGWVTEQQVCDLLLDSRAMILPSFAEGLPVAIMEAFALGRPVISSTITGIPELVQHQQNGWLVVSGDAQQTAASIVECLGTPLERINSMGQHGRLLVLERHDVNKESARLAQLIQQHVATK